MTVPTHFSDELDIINQIMTESKETREARAMLAKAKRDEETEQLSDEQQGYKDTGMRAGDFL